MTDLAKAIAGLTPEQRAVLEARLRRKRREPSARPGLGRRPDPGAHPLSYAQERLWFLEQLEPGTPLYNIPAAFRLSGELAVPALARALEEVVRRHEVLRGRFQIVNGRVVQDLAPVSGLDLPVTHLVDLPAEVREAELSVAAALWSLAPFDLSRGPLARFALLRLSAREHVLLANFHHIAADGWSLGVWLRELGALYEAFVEGEPSPLPELPIQYADYAKWQREWLADSVLEEQISYWREKLAGLEEALELPLDHPRPAAPSHLGGSERVALPGPVASALEGLARGQGATLFMTLLAGFEVLLSRWTSQEDLAVGTPVAGRTRVETEGLIGLFVNTLVLRGELAGEPTFAELLERVRETALGAYGHQDLPFEKLVEALSPDRALSRAPLFQVMFVLQNAPRPELSVSGLRLSGLDLGSGSAKFDLTLTLLPADGGLAGFVEYSRDLFDGATIARLAGHFGELARSLPMVLDLRLSDLPLLSPAERHQLLVEWNVSPVLPAGPRGLHELFAAQAARTPEASALWFAGESLSYGGLDARANRLAHRLRRLGVGPETRVGVCLERTPELVVALLAVLKAGGAYVPLDPRYPEARLELMLADSDARVLVCQESALQSLPDFSGERVVLEREDLSGESAQAPRSGCSAANLAYLIYTSGSTGRPKGVAIEHASAWALVEWAAGAFGPEDLSGVLVSTSVCFDLSVFEIFVPLALGGRLVLAANALELPRLSGAGVTLVNTVPSAMTELVRLGGVPSSVRVVNLAGEPLKRSLVESLYKLGVGRVLNLYGPSEDTTYSTGARIAPGEGRAPAIGRPVLGSLAYVVDRDLRPAPLGAVGELLLGGAGLARGYLGRPELTAERFVPDPWGRGGRLYRTGDRVRYRPDGELEFLGRLDHQVKVRGFRIEPGEIESALLSLSGVRDAAVVVREDAPGDRRLVAYVVGEATASELRRSLAERLPEHMVPGAFVSLMSLPLTPNGKVDRKALPRPEGEREGEYVAPRTPVEELLAGIWSSVLGTERVGARDHFFALGGHSLLAVQVVSRVREVLGVELPVRRLFEAPTLEALAAWIEAERALGTPAAPPLVRRVREGAVPLSFAQERLWFLDQLEPGSAAYNIPGALRLEGDLDVPALERALAEIVDRHEALRTVFRAEAGRPAGVVLEERPALAFFDLSASPDEMPRLAREEALRSFDLSHAPLARFSLLRLGEREHVLLVNLHHIAADGWSLGVLVRELVALYEAFSRSEPSPLPELPVQYADYAAWQREWLEGPVLDEQLAYWTDQLAGPPEALDLPADRPRPAAASYRGATERLALPASLVSALEELARRQGATLFMTLLASFTALLSRWTGQEDFTVGTPVAGRTRLETEGLIGLFVNTLVLRGELRGNPTFAELLERVRETALGAYGHQDLPFEKLVEALSPDRALSRAPLFQVMLVLQNAPMPELSASGLRLSGLALESGTAKFDLSLTLAPEVSGLAGIFEYSRDLFDPATIARLAAHLSELAAGAVADPDRRISELPVLGEAERHQLLIEWNAGSGLSFEPRCLHELFEAQAARTPGAQAVRFEGESLTYGEVNARANRLARHLGSLGVGPGTIVGACLDRSFEMIVGLLGILKAGAAYVPLDPEYPLDRVAFMLADTAAPVLLTQSYLRERLPGAARGLCLDDPALARALGGYRADDVRSGASLDDLAYVIYTSGSTGKPKGVMVHHRGAVNRLLWAQSAYPVTAEDRVLQKASFSFDFSVWESFGPLLAGAVVVLSRPGGHKDSVYLAQILREERITLVHFVPSMLQVFLTEPDLPRYDDLRYVFCGGEALTLELQEALTARVGRPLRNQYGPTEISIDTTDWVCRPGEGFFVPLGRPLSNTAIHLLDRSLQPVPIGASGEIGVGGVGVSRGYLGRPDLTAERFVPDPWSAAPGGRLYRTGDLARRLPDGNLEFRGRIDHQVKVRGFRIELGEIESALLTDPAVREAVVVAREDTPGDRRLVAYVVPAGSEGAPASSGLRDRLRGTLPDHMVPSAFVVLERLPLTPSGKLDRGALPAPERSGPREHGRIAPRTAAEEIVAGIWADLLRLEQVGAEDDFFELGGHSLLGSQAMARLREAFGAALPLRALFETPTVAGLAARLEAERGGEAALPPIRREAGAGPAPLSFPQERLWFLERLEPGIAAYHIPFALRLSGLLFVPAFGAALEEISRRHDVLRTSFPEGDRPVQAVVPFAPFPLPVVDLRGLPPEARRVEVVRLAAEDGRRPFDLARGPLWRACLVATDEQEHVLLATFHHLISDGWSTGVLVRELASLYPALAAGRPSPLPELPIQYGDYARWQREALDGKGLSAQLAYWRERLAGAPAVLALPTDRPRPPVQTFRGGHRRVSLGLPLSADLRRFGRSHGATAYMVLLAAFDLLLYRVTGQTDLSVGSPVANRARVETEGLIGCFMNVLVLRTAVSSEVAFPDLLRRVRDTALGAYAHQDLPFEKLVEALDPHRNLSHSPLFQVMLSFQDARPSGDLLPGLTVDALAVESGTAKFDLSLELAESEEGIVGGLEYNADLFDDATAARLARSFEALTAAVLGSPGALLADLPALAPEARQQLLIEWNDTAAPEPGGSIQELFTAQAARTPERTALIQGSVRISYGELDRAANRLAHALGSLGVGPETIVGVCLERSPALAVALLGILKAGAAYLPLDPAYPADRLAFMMEDARTPVVLAEGQTAGRLPAGPRLLLLPESGDLLERQPDGDPGVRVGPDALAYVIYTSGSTGRPKGVMVPHGGVVNFFAGMDDRLGREPAGTWLAVTSVSFDISVLELFWTLTRGFEVVLAADRPAPAPAARPRASARRMELSLFYFASDEDEQPQDRYRLLLEGARFADEHGFSAVWTPERHFHAFGGLFPNPSVTGAAVAAITRRIGIRAGSVVLPLHSPVRVAEEWSVVDNLSNGRVGISFASGWHPDDFVLAPANFARRKELMFEGIETVRQLWQGEAVYLPGGGGNEVAVRIRPRPVQPELPVWITAAGNEETFRAAGEAGAGLLTHLLGQSLEELAEKIAVYRRAWTPRPGGPAQGHVALMLHTFVHPDLGYVRDKVRAPFTRYLESAVGLLKNMAVSLGQDMSSAGFTEDDKAALLEHAFERYFETSSLFGSPEICLATLERLKEIAVDEAACLIDFGVDVESTLAALEHLDRVRERSNAPAAEEAEVDEDESLPALIARHSVTHLQGTPSLARMLAADPASLASLRPLRRMMVGGEAFPLDLAGLLRSRISGEIHNMYGPTETTVWSATERVDGAVTLGRPIANTEIHLVDRDGLPVPPGVAGELLIGGAGVVRGYLARPELTAERFVPDPWSGRPGARLYRTGDLARRLTDGRIEFLGRLDHQVKIRGFRIELQEIEAALARHPAVRETVVVARREDGSEPRLVAYLVSAPALPAPRGAELRRFLAESLPEHMLPALFVPLEAFPLTPNGKVDRNALPAPDTKAVPEDGYAAPRTPLEEVVAGLWSEVLGLGRVGVHDNFFEIGGHSLLATQLFARLRESLGVELPLRALFEAPTVAGLAERIEPVRGRGERRPMVPVPRRESHPLSFAQQRLWYLDQLQPGNSAYNDHGTVRLVGPLDVRALERSLGEIVRRHETLRTTFVLADARAVQRISPAGPLPLPQVDLAALPQETRELAVRELVRAEARRAFDLSRGPLLRLVLFRTGEREHVLLLAIHHIVWDGWSMVVFSRELSVLYEAFSRGEVSPLPDLTVQYVDFAEWEREWLQGEAYEELLAYWKRQLGGNPPVLLLPTDRPRSAVQTFRGRRTPLALPPDLSKDVKDFSRRHGVTLFMALLAGFKALLHGYTAQTDLVVGTDVAHRSQVATEPLIGFFVNQLVLRTDLSGDPTFAEALGRVREVSLAGYAHQDMPFDKLLGALQWERDLAQTPLFQVKFVLQNAPSSGAGFSGLSLLPLEIDRETSKFDLLFNVIDTESGIAGSVEYNTDLFEATTIERLLRRWEDLLRAAVAHPNTKLSELVGNLAREEREERASLRRERSQVRLEQLRGSRRRPVDLAVMEEVRES